MPAPITFIIHTVFCIIALSFNLFLIVLIATKTPASMRIMSTQTYLLSAVTGVCKITQSARLCFSVYAFLMHGHCHQMVLIAFCFCYRYYAIKTASQSTPVKRLFPILILAHLPMMAAHGYYGTSELFDRTTTLRLFTSAHPAFSNAEEFLLISSQMNLPSILVGTIVTQYTMLPVTAVVIVVSILIHRILSSTLTMSESSRAMHRSIMKGLLIQATLPAFHLIAVFAYKLRQIGWVADSDEFGHLTVGAISVAISPIITVISVRPYRRILIQLLRIGRRSHAIADSYTF